MDVGIVLHNNLQGRPVFRHLAVSFVNDVDDCALKVCVADDFACFDVKILSRCIGELIPTALESDFVISKPHVIPDVV